MIFKEATIGAKGVRGLATRTYFLIHLKAKLRPSHCEGAMPKEEVEGSKGAKGPWSKGIVVASACLLRKCSI